MVMLALAGSFAFMAISSRCAGHVGPGGCIGAGGGYCQHLMLAQRGLDADRDLPATANFDDP